MFRQFSIGGFAVHTYGLLVLVGFLAGLWLARKRAPRFGIDAARLTDACFFALIWGVVGARLLFVLQELPYYFKHPNQLLHFEGLTSFGGLLGGLIYFIYWSRKQKLSLRTVLDVVAPSFLVGHIFGRIGCLLNGCCYGGVCDPRFPLGIHVPGTTALHHPAQVYDSLLNVAGLGILLLIEKRGLRQGQVFGWMLILHGLTRFIYEFWRAGTIAQVKSGVASSTYWGSLPITQAQAFALALMLAGAWFLKSSRPEESA